MVLPIKRVAGTPSTQTVALQEFEPSDKVDADAVPDHDDLNGVDPDEHVDHSTVDIIAGEALAGGGDITTDRTIDLDIDSLVEDAGPNDDDFLVFYDVSGGVHRKVQIDDLVLGAGGGVQLQWQFSTSTTIADPGAGFFRYDNATPASVTQIAVDDITFNGADASNLLNLLGSGDRIYIQQLDDASKFALFSITSVTDNTGWFTIDVTVDSSGTLPDANEVCTWIILFSGAGPGLNHSQLNGGTAPPVAAHPPTGGTQGQALVKSSGTDFDTEWGTPKAPVVQARRTTTFTTTGAWVDVTLDTTDIETDASVVEHNNTNTDDIDLFAQGLYKITVSMYTEIPAQGDMVGRLQARVRVDDAGTGIAGSFKQTSVFSDGSIDFDEFDSSLELVFYYVSAGSEFITLQLQEIDLDGGPDIDVEGIHVTVEYKGATT
jgi:hypothetical protein